MACENEGEAIEFKLTKNAVNCLKLYPQQELEGADLSNSGEGAKRSVAWYVEEAQRLLEDQQRRAESLRTRGGQVAGFGAAVLALIGGNATELVGALNGLGSSRTLPAFPLRCLRLLRCSSS